MFFLDLSLKEEGEGLLTLEGGREFHKGITSMKENLCEKVGTKGLNSVLLWGCRGEGWG